MKLSNRLLLVLVAAVLFLAGRYGFYIGKHITEVNTRNSEPVQSLEFVDTVRVSDTSYFNFEHIVFEMESMRAVVHLTSDELSNIVFDNHLKQLERTNILDYEMAGDTLYVREVLNINHYKSSIQMTQKIKSFNATDLKIRIYTNNLKGITLRKSSNVKVQGTLSNSGRSFLPDLTVEQNSNTVFKVEHLDLGIFNHYQIVDKKYRFQWASIYLDNGSASYLNFHNLNTELNAFDFPADSIYLKEAPDNQHKVEIHANEYLNVDLTSKSNSTVYKGHPAIIIKKERGRARLINGNLPPLE